MPDVWQAEQLGVCCTTAAADDVAALPLRRQSLAALPNHPTPRPKRGQDAGCPLRVLLAHQHRRPSSSPRTDDGTTPSPPAKKLRWRPESVSRERQRPCQDILYPSHITHLQRGDVRPAAAGGHAQAQVAVPEVQRAVQDYQVGGPGGELLEQAAWEAGHHVLTILMEKMSGGFHENHVMNIVLQCTRLEI